MKTRFITSALAAGLLAFFGAAMAEDIDLFIGVPNTNDKPNVLFVIDNAADFSSNASGAQCKIDGNPTALSGKVGGIEQCALYQVINALSPNSVNVGMMFYNGANVLKYDDSACNSSGTGGCLVFPISAMTATNKSNLLAYIKAWKVTGSGTGYVKASNEATGASIQEAFAYLTGRLGISTTNYSSIKPDLGCNKNYIVFIGNSFSSSGSPSDQTGVKGPANALNGTNTGGNALMNAYPAATTKQKTVMTTTVTDRYCPPGAYTFPGSNHETGGYYADEWTRYLNGEDIATTYAIGVLKSGGTGNNACQVSYESTLWNMATEGGGRYFGTFDTSDLVTAFQTILNEIQAKNSVFASVSLPVSVNTEGTYLNQVFIGMFRPDPLALPRWYGNLKQYKLGVSGGALKLLDADSQLAISQATSGDNAGFIHECARSFWTPTSEDHYWTIYDANEAAGERVCPASDTRSHPDYSNYPDGKFVEKGAQGYVLRGDGNATSISRTLRTCTTSGCTGLSDLTDSLTWVKSYLNTTDATEQTNLINWERGLNNAGDEFWAPTAMRPSSHGDVVHSRPAAINFGTDTSPQVVVFYGGNDGVLRAVNGNRSTAIGTGSTPAGAELWGFVPPEFFQSVKRLRDNDTSISFKGSTMTSPTPQPKPYGIDGPMTTYRSGSTTWLFAGMRRGGSAIYAFDISNTTSTGPTLKWRKALCDSVGGSCTTSSLSRLGQTWSAPKVLKTGYNSGAPLLIMGGGYDTCEDADGATCSGTDVGKSVFVLDANLGSVLNSSLHTDRAVVADVFVVTDNRGYALWAYAADLGGNIYRISGDGPNTPISAVTGYDTANPSNPVPIYSSPDPSTWQITKIASLGCDSVVSSCTTGTQTNRKFMYTPDVVAKDGTYYLMVGSGDREKPLGKATATTAAYWPKSYATENYFFMVKDRPLESTWLSSENGTCGANVICLDSLWPITTDSPSVSQVDTKKGWYLVLNTNHDAGPITPSAANHYGEQVVTSAITVFGTVTFSTQTPHVPTVGECTSDLGTARVYNVSFENAAGTVTSDRSQIIRGGGLPPSPVAGMVTLDDGTTVPFIIGADPTSPLEGKLPSGSAPITQPRGFQYWHIKK